ncbi:helix-turn-helix domain-containing protein [Dermatophilaceae bacterium Soc4.6]
METFTADRRPFDLFTDRSADPTPLLPLLLTLTEVAAHLRCTRRSVERQVAGGHLHVVHVGRAVRVERRELDRYLAALRDLELGGAALGGAAMGGVRGGAGGGDAG